MLWIAALWLAPAFAIECKEPVQHEELVAALDAAEAFYVDLEEEAFRDKVNEISGLLLPCVEAQIAPELAARYHRNLALQLSAVGDEIGAQETLQAAYNAHPEFVWDDAMLAADHPLRVTYDGLQAWDAGSKVAEPRSGSISFDGVNGRFRPSTPLIYQRFDATGRATETLYVGPGEGLPTYSAIPRKRNTLIGCAGGALGLSGTTWLIGRAQRGSLYSLAADPTTSADQLDKKRGSANALAVVSTALFGVAAGCGTGAWLVGEQ
ncbi:MAG: hypothetical protein KC912_24275 [Proteobacteria bacterium]|nr:hypothetical protein [Pseudomonadota bacterium]